MQQGRKDNVILASSLTIQTSTFGPTMAIATQRDEAFCSQIREMPAEDLDSFRVLWYPTAQKIAAIMPSVAVGYRLSNRYKE